MSFHREATDPSTGKKYPAHYVVDGGEYKTAAEVAAIPSHFIDEHGASLLPDGNKAAMTLEIVVPKNLPQERVTEFVAHVMKAFDAQIGKHTIIKLRYSYFDVDERLLELDNVRKELDNQLIQVFDPEQKGAILVMKDVVEGEVLQLKEWNRKWYEKLSDKPRATSFAAYMVATAKGTIAFTLTISRYGWNWVGGILAAFRASVTAAFGYKAYDFAQWATEVKFFFTTDHPELEKLKWFPFFNWFNNNKTFKSISISLFINFFVNYGTRLTAYMAGLSVMDKGVTKLSESPNTAEFFSYFLANSAVELWGDAKKQQGVRTLLQKGVLNFTTASILLYSAGIVDTAYQSLLGMGLNKAATVVNFSNVAIMKVGTFVASRIMKPGERKIVAISGLIPKINDKRQYLKSDLNYVIRQLSIENGIQMGPAVELQLRQKQQLPLKDFIEATGLSNLPLSEVQIIYNRFYGLGSEPKQNLVRSCRNLLASG
ncbi:MAG: hypothetical protein R3A80_13525 [Bdellovibrionota bacterium]